MSGVGSDLLFANSASALNANIVMTNSSLSMLQLSTLGAATVTQNGGALIFSAASSGGQASITLNSGSVLQFTNYLPILPGTTIGSLAGSGTVNLTDTSNGLIKSLIIGGNNQSTTFSGQIIGGGLIVKQGSGTLNLTGNNTYAGGTIVNAGTLAVNGSLASGVAVLSGGTLGGVGTINGPVFVNGTIAPGNSIGTINVNGTYIQSPGSTYQVEVGSQSDLIKITGNAIISGGTVAVQAGAGARPTTYTIVTATGGVTGTYSGLTSNLAFVTPSLSYDAKNVFLTLRTSFAGGGGTGNEIEVGGALDKIKDAVSGDLDTVLTALTALDRLQGLRALDVISGQPYADFGTLNVNNAALFMNTLAQQMAMARGGGGTGQRQALAQACDIVACDGLSPWSAWASALGGLGSVLGDGNTSTLTYNFGGVAAGVDYRFDPRFLVGIGVGYTHGTEWVNGFPGQGWTDSVSVAAYASFSQGGFYVDALAGYAYYNNQLQRQMSIPGLQPRTATGSTGANQFLGQVETGYRLGLYAPASATITPFGRLQASSVTQNAFTEAGAQSLNLNVAQQITNSLRTVVGADLAGAIGLGNERKLDLALRLGWMHEFAYTGRPITAAFSGAPSAAFTVYAATPQRDSAVIGFSASTAVADATQIYLRYDGAVGGGTDNHMLNVGVRFSW